LSFGYIAGRERKKEKTVENEVWQFLHWNSFSAAFRGGSELHFPVSVARGFGTFFGVSKFNFGKADAGWGWKEK
jgi:hypothetical protein